MQSTVVMIQPCKAQCYPDFNIRSCCRTSLCDEFRQPSYMAGSLANLLNFVTVWPAKKKPILAKDILPYLARFFMHHLMRFLNFANVTQELSLSFGQQQHMRTAHEVCSHITNALRAQNARVAVHDTIANRAIVHCLYNEGFFNSYALGNHSGPYLAPTPRTPANCASRRIWINLKYRDGVPVLSKIAPVSLPSRKVYASMEDLLTIAAARNSGTLLKAQVLGQVTIVETIYGIIELKQALEKRVGGKVLCYAF